MIAAVLILLSLIPFYLIGAVPVGALIARSHGLDITACGSGNVGAANVTRVLGRKAGMLTLLGDVLKGLAAVGSAMLCTSAAYYPCLAGVAAVAGHCFSIPGKLKGGRGVATTLGAAILLDPAASGLGAAVYALVMWRFRIPSVASLCGTLLAPLFSFFTGVSGWTSLSLAAMALLVLLRHKENIKRLIEGREEKLSISG